MDILLSGLGIAGIVLVGFFYSWFLEKLLKLWFYIGYYSIKIFTFGKKLNTKEKALAIEYRLIFLGYLIFSLLGGFIFSYFSPEFYK
jgi:uncharacterized membrane protein SirB2